MTKNNTQKPIEMVPGQLYSPEQLAEFMGVAHQTLSNWRVRGEGPPFVKITKGVVRYRGEEVLAYLDAMSSRGGETE